MKDLDNRQRTAWQSAMIAIGLALALSCYVYGQSKKIEQKTDRPAEQTIGHNDEPADTTIQTSSPLVHSSLTDSLSKEWVLQSSSRAGTDGSDTAPPEWMQALNHTETLGTTDATTDPRDPFRISELINDRNQEITAIYQQFLKRWPDLEGKLTVRIHLAPSGSVVKAEIAESTLNRHNFANAVLEVISRWNGFGVCSTEKIKIYRQQYIFGE